MIVARSSGVAVVRRISSSSSEMSSPSRRSTSIALSSSDHTWFSDSRPERRSAIRAVWAGPSATTAAAPESPRIHSICSADDVSYTGTVTAPANQIA